MCYRSQTHTRYRNQRLIGCDIGRDGTQVKARRRIIMPHAICMIQQRSGFCCCHADVFLALIEDLYEFCLSKFCICLCAHGPTQPSNYVQAMPSATDPDKTNYLATVCILCVWLAGSGSGLALEIRPSAIIQEHSASIVMPMHCSVCYIYLHSNRRPRTQLTPSISRVESPRQYHVNAKTRFPGGHGCT